MKEFLLRAMTVVAGAGFLFAIVSGTNIRPGRSAGEAGAASDSGRKPAGAPAEKPARYICTPCSMTCDAKVFDHAGTCPECGAKLVRKEEANTEAPSPGNVALLIFNGVEIIDYTGPFEVFGNAGFEVYTVAETREPVTTAMGMTVVPKYTFADAPRPDILVVPGGDVRAPRASAATLKWVADETAHTTHTLSVCNGAFILAGAGLLDGLGATTTARLIDRLQSEFPKIKTVRDRRFVDNGRIITAAGLSSGIDGALHVVARVMGEGTAQAVALGIEYDWRPGSGYARAALADRLIPEIDLDDLGAWEIVRTEGGTDHWEMVARTTSSLSAAELRDRIGEKLSAGGSWTRVAAPAAGSASRAGSEASRAGSDWSFRGRDGSPWTGRLAIETAPGRSRGYIAALTIRRAAEAAGHRATLRL
ncbi:MAG TPA: DJ-1/PfpI family protein [Candidatus Polarisedimenticolia bacterium]